MTTLTRSTAPSARIRTLDLIATTLSLLALNRSRTRLSQLDAAALEDIGVTEAQARREAARPVWDVPGNWLR